MEWIKNMSLKKSLFTLTLINLLLALSLSAVVFVGCTKLSAVFAPSGVQIIVGADSTIKTEFPEPVAGATAVRNALAIFQFVLPMLFFIVALILTAIPRMGTKDCFLAYLRSLLKENATKM